MNYRLRSLLIAIITFSFLACKKPANVTLPKFDAETWKKDRMACDDKRTVIAAILLPQLDSLKGLNEGEVIALLGRPDRNDLSARNTKTYYYFYTPGQQCIQNLNAHKGDSLVKAYTTNSGLYFRLRFNAVGLVHEIIK